MSLPSAVGLSCTSQLNNSWVQGASASTVAARALLPSPARSAKDWTLVVVCHRLHYVREPSTKRGDRSWD